MSKKTPKLLNAHAKRRAEERYGLTLNNEARREIVKKIKANQAEFVGKTSNNRSLWRVIHQNEPLNVVYDKARGAMCTVLPKEAREFQGGTDWQEAEREYLKTQARRDVTAELAEIWKDVE